MIAITEALRPPRSKVWMDTYDWFVRMWFESTADLGTGLSDVPFDEIAATADRYMAEYDKRFPERRGEDEGDVVNPRSN